MPRRALPYSLERRHLSNKGKYVYYCRPRDPESGIRLGAISTGKTNRATAIAWVEARLADGTLLQASTSSEVLPLGAYLRNFYDYDKSPYIQGRLQRGSSFTRTSAALALSTLELHVIPYFGEDCRLSKLRPLDIEKWLMGITSKAVTAQSEQKKPTRKITPATANRIYGYFRTAIKEAARLGIIPRDPTATVKQLAPNYKTRGILSPLEAARVLEPERWKDRRLWAANLIMAATGLRLGELRALMPQHIHEDHIEVCCSYSEYDGLKGTKTGKNRIIPITNRVHEILTELCSGVGTKEFIFKGAADAPLTPFLFLESLRKVMDDLEIDHRSRGIVCHSWRHFFASIMRGKVPDHIAAKLTGHSTVVMLNHYSGHDLPENMEAVRSVQRMAFCSHESRSTMDDTAVNILVSLRNAAEDLLAALKQDSKGLPHPETSPEYAAFCTAHAAAVTLTTATGGHHVQA